MTFFRKHAQLLQPLALLLFLLTFLWGISALYRTGSVRVAGVLRQSAHEGLLALAEEAQALDRVMDTSSVDGDISRDIQDRISQTFEQVQSLAPQLVGAYRLHQVEVSVAGDTVLSFLEKVEKLQELPIRLQRVDLGVRDDNQAVGGITIAWLEQL